jgi:hypothetical protein
MDHDNESLVESEVIRNGICSSTSICMQKLRFDHESSTQIKAAEMVD